MMRQLHQYISVILDQRGFVAQLNTGVMFGAQNWNMI